MNSNKKIILVIFLLLALIFITVFVFIQPTFSEVKNLAKQVEQEQEELETLYQKGQTLTHLKNELKEIGEKQHLLDNIFLVERKELEFITLLEKIALANNVSQNVSLQEKRILKDNYKSMNISLSLRTDFFDFIKYLQEIEKLDFYFNIRSLNITSSTGRDDQLAINLEASTYWQQK